MTTFPVISSILSADILAGFIQQEYQFEDPTTCKLLKTGISHTYQVKSGKKKFVFRVYSLNWRTANEILEEIRLINLLKENQLGVSYPITDPAGTYIKELHAPEGTRFGVLFSHAEGKKALNYADEIHFNIGVMMARIHVLTHNLKLDRVVYIADVLLDQSFKKICSFQPMHRPEMVYMSGLKTVIAELMETVDLSKVRHGAVHLDIWFDNMHFTENNEVTIFDFDFCGNGLLVLDIGYYAMQLYNLEKDEKIYKEKLKSFLDGYGSISKITDEESRILPFMSIALYFFYLGVQCQRYDNWSNIFLNEIYLERFIKLIVKKWADYNQILTSDV